MNIIRIASDENGGYPSIQSWDGIFPPAGYAVWPEELDTAEFYAYNGFVTLTVEPMEVVTGETQASESGEGSEAQAEAVNTVKSYAPNTEAWEAWKASLPEPKPVEPTVEERVSELEDALAQTDETAIALYEAQEAQEEVNAAQDEALIELYERIGG